MPLVERALQVLERRAVQPQLGLLKSTMLQLDSAFTEKAYGANSFSDFVEKLKKADYVNVSGQGGRYIIERKGASQPERPTPKPEEALPPLRDVLETHRLEMENGVLLDDLAGWVQTEVPNFSAAAYGFQEFSEFLNYAQDKLVVRVEPDEEKGPIVYMGAEFYPPAEPEKPVGAACRGRRGREAADRGRPAFAARAESSAGQAQAGAPGAQTRGIGEHHRPSAPRRRGHAQEASAGASRPDAVGPLFLRLRACSGDVAKGHHREKQRQHFAVAQVVFGEALRQNREDRRDRSVQHEAGFRIHRFPAQSPREVPQDFRDQPKKYQRAPGARARPRTANRYCAGARNSPPAKAARTRAPIDRTDTSLVPDQCRARDARE